MTEIKIKLKPFTVPNYVIAEMPPRSKQEGFVENPKWHISEVSIEVLEQMCAEFREAVISKHNGGRPE